MKLKNIKKLLTLFVILRALVIAVMVAQIFNKNYENVFLCLLTLVLFIGAQFYTKEFPYRNTGYIGNYNTPFIFVRGDTWRNKRILYTF